MNGKIKATEEIDLIKTYMTMGKSTSLLVTMRKTYLRLTRELKMLPKTPHMFFLQSALLNQSLKRL